MEHQFFATAPRGFSDLLARELGALGATGLHERGAGVRFRGALAVGYGACLWSRIASRVLLELSEFDAPNADALHAAVMAIDWSVHINPDRSIACDFTGTHPTITNTHYGALRLKDGICDRLRAATGLRPDVALTRPAVRVIAHAQGTHVALSLDLAGEGLHRRGYRTEAGEAPLRENLAAGLLLRARWDEAAARGAEFLDPLCGSGTFVIEAALIAAGWAPALRRGYFGFLGWRGHDAALWQRLLEAARARARSSVENTIRGSDIDALALALCAANAERAGIAALVRFEHQALDQVRPRGAHGGLVCTNPPYGERIGGERLGDDTQARAVHATLGRVLRERFAGWDAAILTTAGDLARELRLRSYRVHEVHNGAIECRFLRIDLAAPGRADSAAVRRARAAAAPLSAGAQMFANRLEKNSKHLGKAAQRAGVSCYRLYDADMPEYSFAIDRYVASGADALHLLVQEYAAPREIELEAARRRRGEVLAALPRLFDLPRERIHLRLRERQSGAAQYQPLNEAPYEARDRTGAPGGPGPGDSAFEVAEGGLKFIVNLEDYLDTGLFLDHRLVRARLRAQAREARFLNLFCYTASATVYAAAGGARSSLSIDLSNRYLDWAAQNYALNGLEPARHRLERADCCEWLRAAAQADDSSAAGAAGAFDLILLDPPTFSNSKRMQGVLDVQRDHLELIDGGMRLLAPGGLLLFSSNAQRFRLDPEVERRWAVQEVSKQTLPFDFARNPRIHRCFEIRVREPQARPIR